MKYLSTNKKSPPVSLQEAVLHSLAPDGGLYMPEKIPELGSDFFARMAHLSFQEIACEVARPFLSEDVDDEVLRTIVENSLTFDAPLVALTESFFVLELFHGPTAAFKDFGARFMAQLTGNFAQKIGKEITILAATSGDTGSAVAHSFFGVKGVRVIILYPSGKVSPLQEKMLTTMGGNVTALEIDGSFDDCQRLVKEAFLDEELNKKLFLTSANSINIGRLLPQMFYYFWAYAQFQKRGTRDATPIIVSVPSGNFGNLTAGLIAKKMGLPITRFIAATNANATFPEYLRTGIFTPRTSKHTLSNAMDVGNPSNFARIQTLYKNDLAAMHADIESYSFSDDETKAALQEMYHYGYTAEPHTAVAYLGLRQYFAQQPKAKMATGILLSTAHPGKFREVVEPTLGIKVALPSSLQTYLSKEKRAISLSFKKEDFFAFLCT